MFVKGKKLLFSPAIIKYLCNSIYLNYRCFRVHKCLFKNINVNCSRAIWIHSDVIYDAPRLNTHFSVFPKLLDRYIVYPSVYQSFAFLRDTYVRTISRRTVDRNRSGPHPSFSTSLLHPSSLFQPPLPYPLFILVSLTLGILPPPLRCIRAPTRFVFLSRRLERV